MATDVTYLIASERLFGTVAGEKFAFNAYSGGGRGTTNDIVAEFTLASFSPYRKMNQQRNTRGGAIPPGTWRIEVPREAGDPKGPWVSLLTPDTETRERYPQRDFDVAPFKIHGNGPLGSDGCIVIKPGHRIPFLEAVKKAGGASLTVLWQGDRMNERLEQSQRLQHYA
jgi:hypothetical protein